MGKSCPYCAQTDTKKDSFGYCSKYHCFEQSKDKTKYEDLKSELRNAQQLPTSKRNFFDGSYYNPREEETHILFKKIVSIFGFLPIEAYKIGGGLVIEL
jgi:hypothetical protein